MPNGNWNLLKQTVKGQPFLWAFPLNKSEELQKNGDGACCNKIYLDKLQNSGPTIPPPPNPPPPPTSLVVTFIFGFFLSFKKLIFLSGPATK